MAQYPFLVFSDAHLRNRPDEPYALAQVVTAAIAREVKLVLAAGDLFDRQTNRAGPIAFFHQQLDRLEGAKIAFAYTQGQHDFDEPPWLSSHRWAQHLHKKVIEVGSFKIYGLDWQPFGKLQEELNEIPEDVNVLVAHQVWGDWMGSIACPQGDFAQVPAQVRWLLSGDLHQVKDETAKNAGGGDMRVFSTGALYMQKADEPHEYYYGLMRQDGVLVHRKLKSRPLVELDLIDSDEALNDAVVAVPHNLDFLEQTARTDDLPADVAKPVIRVPYHSRYTDTVRRIEKAVEGRATLLWREIPPAPTEFVGPDSTAEPGEAVTPLSVLDDELDREAHPAAYDLVTRVLTAENQEQAFASWRKDFMGENLEEPTDPNGQE